VTVDLVQEPTPSLPEIPAPRRAPAGRRRHTPRAFVITVVLARDGAARLPRVLAALAGATRPPDAVVGVDLGSRDASAAQLAAAMPVLLLPRSATAADGVESVLALRAAGALAHEEPRAEPNAAEATAVAAGAVEWIWLVPHDAAPDAAALERLLLAVETAPSVGIAGCKQVAWDDDQRLLDVGFTASPLGLRVTGVDPHEVDQGQHDGRSDVLAVGGAGMLVRRDVWDELGGLDPGLDDQQGPGAGDLDLCRRAHLAGHRVVVVPGAVVARGSARPSRRAARRAVLHLRLAAAPLPLLPLAVLAVLVGAPVRALALLAAGRPRTARAELLATLAALAHPLAWRRTRRRAARARRVPPRVLRRLRPTLDLLWRQRYDAVHAWLTPPPADEGAAARVPAAPPFRRRVRGTLAALGPVLVTALAGLVLARRLVLGGGVPAGSGLLPAPSTAGALWAAATSSWRHVGLGARAVADPFGALLAAASVPLGGDPDRAVRVLLVAGLPLSALAAWTAAAALTRSRVLRWWAALAWAGAPPLLSAVCTGRPAAVLAHVLLPPVAGALAHAAGLRSVSHRLKSADAASTHPRLRRPLATACRLGLLLTALLAAAPSLAAPAAAVLAGAAVAGRRRAIAPLMLAAAIPAVLLLPWWSAVVRAPRLLLADPALATAAAGAGTGPGSPDWLRMLTAPVPATLGPVVGVAVGLAVVLPVAVAAVLGPLRRRAGGLAVLGWWAAGIGAAGTAVVVRTALAAPEGEPLAGLPGPCLSLALAGLGAAALLAADVLPARLRRLRRAKPARRALCAAAGAALAGGLAAPAAAAWTGAEPAPSRSVVLPAVATAEAQGAAATRTLVLSVERGSGGAVPPGSQLRWSLIRAGGPVLGDASADLAVRAVDGRDPLDRDARVILPTVGALLAGGGRDPRPALADLAVGSVVLLPPADHSDQAAVTLALDATPGLVRLGDSRAVLLWRVEPPSGSGAPRPYRARLVEEATGRTVLGLPSSGDAVDATVPAGAPGRLAVLAERFDAGWQARLDGVPLPAVRYHRWSQAFVLPAAGGRLEVTRREGLVALTGPVRATALALALVGALPLPRLRDRLGPLPPPRPSRPVPRPGPAPEGLRPAAAPRVFDDEHPEDGARPLFVGPPPRRPRRRFRLRLRRRRRTGAPR
jgi:GT2 family glycosyltransferase